MEGQKLNRHFGIDFLRIISMFLIIILHILGQGGVLEHATGSKYELSLLLQIIALPSVNCYALISGYVGYSDSDTTFKFSKYILMWVQVLTYTLGITLLAFIIFPRLIEFKLLIFSVFPVFTKNYWYFSAYTALFLFVPYINKAIRNCSEKEAKKIIIVIFLIFSFFGTFFMKFDPFTLNRGYSFLWLMFLYIIGALFKKFNIIGKQKVKNYIFMYILSILITFIIVIFIPQKFFGNTFYLYTMPTILFMSIIMFSLFLKLKFTAFFIKVIEFLSPTVFGVYIIHVQSVVWIYFLKDRFSFISNLNIFIIPFLVIFYSIIIFIFCAIIEKIRIHIFNILDMKNKAEKIETILLTLLDKAIIIFEKL